MPRLNQMMIAIFLMSSCTAPTPSQDRQLNQLSHQVGQKQRELLTPTRGLVASKTLAMRQSELKKAQDDLQNFLTTHSLARKNLSQLLAGNGAGITPMVGDYEALVIPVQFEDLPFQDLEFFTKGFLNRPDLSRADVYLFGSDDASDERRTERLTLTTYFRHASLGRFNLYGTVFPPVTVPEPRAYYGAASEASGPDMQAQNLVVDAIDEVKKAVDRDANIVDKKAWWARFDRWDPIDFDQDGIYNEPDGFVDSIMVIYAGNSQASCQAIYDPLPDNASETLRAKAGECFERLWPHRSGITTVMPIQGPLVNGVRREPLGQRINNTIHAYDYNMQSEYSDLATYAHEFLHSLAMPDVYALSGGNSASLWNLMAEIGETQPQELSSFEKILAGWLTPHVVRQGEDTSLYLGTSNLVTRQQRNQVSAQIPYAGPSVAPDASPADEPAADILSIIPNGQEAVYRAVVVVPEPELDAPDENGNRASHQQFYILEYRDPERVPQRPEEGYNSDRQTRTMGFALFTERGGTTLADQFRLVEVPYQPGLVAWYFNDRQPRTAEGNSPALTGGLGHLLPINAAVQETIFPDRFSDAALLDGQGFYAGNNQNLQALYKDQEQRFACFAKRQFLRHLEQTVDCGTLAASPEPTRDFLEDLSLDGRKLMFTYQKLETLLPFHSQNLNQEQVRAVSDVVFASPYTRAALASFQNEGAISTVPLKVYRKGLDNQNMILDDLMMRRVRPVQRASSFDDAVYTYPEHHPADSVRIVPRGLQWRMREPSPELLELFDSENPDEHSYRERRPRTHLEIRWRSPGE